MTFKKEDIRCVNLEDTGLHPELVIDIKRIFEEIEKLKNEIEANMYVGFIGSIDVKNVIRILSNIEQVFDNLVRDIKQLGEGEKK